jgi:uncharacterized protein
MSLSMYDLSVPVFLRGLEIVSEYSKKAKAFASEQNIDPAVLVNARLAPDMRNFAGQVQLVSDSAKGAVGRLAGVSPPSFPDVESTFDDLIVRVANTISFVGSVTRDQVDASESRLVETQARGFKEFVRGDWYLLSIALPNLYFHLTTAHDILRHNGVPLGKRDYLFLPAEIREQFGTA